ncbi:hypothetical protein LWI29_027951 [Acer saccharum]|uniref:NAD(P)H-quinone oxidoreductase subunit S, chloroplastic n=1 Tax=Acer saccharum TaxID=4024 RepID=A0AA39VP03_ACESA|nr:hypothetical protein LWI29_027951 [Acer saccharum]
MASSSLNFPTLQGPLLKSRFLGQNNIAYRPQKPFLGTPKQSSVYLKPCAKFDLFEILGGRGLCKGEKGIQQELTRDVTKEASQIAGKEQGNSGSSETSMITSVPENAFEKEMLGLTGGFPGGEKGLKQFIEKNPPPPKKPSVSDSGNVVGLTTTKKPKAPELPLLMPGMFAIVKNSNNPFYMYTGIVQRITDGKAGVLFEGGNWDRLVTFRLDELQRRDKGPPGKNPKSAILEEMLEKKESQ